MRKRNAESRWSHRRRGYYYLVTAVGLFGFFLILAGISSRDWTWVFAVLGFASLVLCMQKGLALWNVDRLVFDQDAFGRTTGRQMAETPKPEPRERVPRVSATASRRLRFAERGPSHQTQ